jgi:hypothetical protein
MVRAILAGTKSQTRRVFPVSPSVTGLPELAPPKCLTGWHFHRPDGDCEWHANCPYGLPGETLWVRETFCWLLDEPGGTPVEPERFLYRADNQEVSMCTRWRPSIYMPRWASRITLEVTNVRVERLQSISEEDARAEGCSIEAMPLAYIGGASARGVYRDLWDKINGKRTGCSWADNPWVWCISFKRTT